MARKLTLRATISCCLPPSEVALLALLLEGRDMPLACHGGSKRRNPSLIAYAMASRVFLNSQPKRLTRRMTVHAVLSCCGLLPSALRAATGGEQAPTSLYTTLEISAKLMAYAISHYATQTTYAKTDSLRSFIMLWNLIRLASSPVTCHWHVTPLKGKAPSPPPWGRSATVR